jgi:hypothetical protein
MANDTDATRWGLSILAMVIMLAVYTLARASADRWLAPDSPKRAYADQVILYGSTLLLLLILWLLER